MENRIVINMPVGPLMMYLHDLRCEDSRKRLNALKHVEMIAIKFDLQRTVSELLPFLREFEDDDEDILLTLCEVLVSLERFIVRKRGDVREVIPFFEIPLASEDFSVINLAITKLAEIAKATRYDCLFILVTSLLTRKSDLATISAIRICCRLNGNIPEKRYEQVAEILQDAAKCPRILVRRELAKELGSLIEEAGQLEKPALNVLKQLSEDPQESVQFAAAQSWFSLSSVSKPYFLGVVFPILEDMITSPSWRVRYSIASKFANILLQVFPSEKSKQLIGHIVSYINDPEIEVAIKTTEILKDLTQFLSRADVDLVIPALQTLVEHESFDLRLAIAKSLPSLAFVELGDNSEAYIKLVNRLLCDPRSEISIELLANFQPIWNNFSREELTKVITPILIRLLDDSSWTIRRQAVLSIERIAQKLGEKFADDPLMISAFRAKLSDRVLEIRDNTISLLGGLAEHFGPEYAEKTILPIFQEFKTHKNYLYRSNYLKGVSLLPKFISPAAIRGEVATIHQLCSDPVPNVRQQAITTLSELFQARNDKLIEEAMTKIVEERADDPDLEVQAARIRIKQQLEAETMLAELDELRVA